MGGHTEINAGAMGEGQVAGAADPRAEGEADPRQPRTPASEPADAWALEQARRELEGVRARAAVAEEQRLAEQRRAEELARGLEAVRAALEGSERRRALDQVLFERGARDVEVARLLAERAMGEGADAEAAVREVRRRRPHLFAGSGAGVAGAAPWTDVEEPEGYEEIAGATRRAQSTGDRDAVLRYLRLKRGV